MPSAKVIHNFGRADGLDRDALARLVASISRFLDPAQAITAAHTGEKVTSFLVGESHRLSPKTLQRSATALRVLLRYWHVQGLITTCLVDAVPKVAYRSPGVARGLRPAQVGGDAGVVRPHVGDRGA